MDLTGLLALAVTGLVRGGLYALMALGLALVFGVMNIAHFAHGEIYAIGAYAAYFAYAVFGFSPILAIVAAGITSFVAGMLIEKGLFYPLRKGSKGDWLMNSFLVTVGLSFVLKNGAQAIWGAQFRGISQYWEDSIRILPGVSLAYDRAIAFVISIAAIVIFWLILRRTEFGRAMRAVSQNETGALLVGIDLDRIQSITFALSSMLAGLAGAAMLSILPAYPSMGMTPNNKSWFVVMLVGLGNVGGSIVGGFMVGILETVTYYFLGGGWQDVVSLSVLILILLFKPSGLFGTTEVKGRLER